MEVRIKGPLACNDCGHVMRPLNPQRTEIACSNEDCENFSKKFLAPVIRLSQKVEKTEKKKGGKKQ